MVQVASTRGKVRSERTIQTYARSARAFFHWLVRRETIERNPFDRVPKRSCCKRPTRA